MTIKIYVGRDSEGRPRPPDHTDENQALLDILKRLWRVFDPGRELVVVMANLRRPSADLVVLTRFGVGVAELKHYPGRISRNGDAWYADSGFIKSGAESLARRNPHEQVQSYATDIRDLLLSPRQIPPWLPGNRSQHKEFQINTAVCFTHPDADFLAFRRDLRRDRPRTHPWEKFEIVGPKHIPEWVASLRFEELQGREQGFDPYVLEESKMLPIATQLFDCTEWTDGYLLMPTGEPYGYLTLLEAGQRAQVYALDREDLIIGRDPLGGVPVPERFSRAGRQHARIWRELGQVFLEDLDSSNGTYVNQLRLNRKRSLRAGDKISLGGSIPGGKVCLLEFSFASPVKPQDTEVSFDNEGGGN